ncbi:MAG: Sec-independent protein translocase protein TatB [Cardiobacteriaceae bacterium]|nr:Sec-independent protein translocase protein TatB [Cardiobacteriaceae bacterium]
MFEIGFSELLLIMVIGILVIGPQQLPEVVRSVVLTVRKIQRALFEARDNVERELDLYDLKKSLHDEEMERHMRELNQSILDLEKLPDRDPAEANPSLADEYQDTGIETERPLPPQGTEHERNQP